MALANPQGGGEQPGENSVALSEDDTKREILERLYKDRFLAHTVLFPHRHKNIDPEFHKELKEILYAPDSWVALKAFRGAAKSTIVEEVIIICALFGDFKYALILGNSYDRACERLAAIKNEFETNDVITELFGAQTGGTWAADQIVITNGCKIQAFGARQSLRGAKHNDQRPDFLFVDDLEDEENVATEDARRKLKRWFNGALIPAMDPKGKIRMVGTPLHPKSLLETKMTDPAWLSASFPVLYFNEDGEEVSAWPDRFPLEYINKLRTNYTNDGTYVEFEQEYMCRSEDAAAKPFQTDMIKISPVLPSWKYVQVVVDPARTINATSARTGYTVFAWVGNTLEVYEGFGEFHLPDKIVQTIFELDDKYSPAEIGVEADGLEEFIMQPLRAEMLKRGRPIPLIKLKAPKNKDNFIRGLQPFYKAGEVIHAKNLPDLTSELLQFPTGRKDVPNALAYAPRMRVGKPVYENFAAINVSPAIETVDKRQTAYLALSARASSVSGVLVQYINGRVIIYNDWIKEGPPSEMLERLIQDALMYAGKAPVLVAPKEQFNKYTNFGLIQAAKKLRYDVKIGAEAQRAQGGLNSWITKSIQGSPALIVSDTARWTLNGFTGGYARKLNSSGQLQDQPEDNLYVPVLEAIECFVQWFDIAAKNEGETSGARFNQAADGRRYMTSRG